ncbi:MAG: MFS transporter [Candidatus Thermoplasmatota archaeon]|nr:MFS transporter [Candidatus Thermoplasmatota archaeon]MCL5929827.1 MFS transporter [Candidatus Thermoplasmatota archaeon]
MRTFGTGGVWSFTPLFMKNELQISLLLIGLIFAINAIFGGFVQIYAGHLGDKYGFKRIILIFAFTYILTLLLLFSSALFFPIPMVFVLLFIVNQAVGSLIMPSLSALLSISSDVPLAGFSYMRVASNLGWAFGPALAGVIAGTLGYPYIYFVAALTAIGTFPLYFFLREMKVEGKEIERFSFHKVNKELYLFGIGVVFLFVVVSQFSVTLSIYANNFVGLSTSAIGLIYFVNGISVAAFQLPIYRLVRRIGLWNGMIIGSVLYIIGYFSMALDHSLWQFMVSMLIVTMGENSVTPTGSAMVSKIANGKSLGAHMGVYNFFMSLGRGMGPSYGSFLLSYLVSPFDIWGLAVVPALVGIVVFVTRRSEENKKNPSMPFA